jgi:hypothetical protein
MGYWEHSTLAPRKSTRKLRWLFEFPADSYVAATP